MMHDSIFYLFSFFSFFILRTDILETDIAFLIVFTIMLSLSIYCAGLLYFILFDWESLLFFILH